ncbi:MAG TPA: type II toxin-antitoxin system VapC family toxin [Candidatus Ruania gallistercoris]|uniref:Ribonuclease VapC n=1 Tax=Candidatus Ruania gallistercoris TaxID=2838746 RepID=A0A9D2EFZ2_9MICO|nr:type II toxin-antitoxin system VapC family toxin [Candidatus Ruania gallistercoris]
MIVVDASAVVDALTGVDGGADLRDFLGDKDLHAPTLLDFEVVSAVRGLALGRHLSVPRAEEVLSDFDDLPLHRWHAAAGQRLRTFTLRDNLSAYDAAYIALAEALECPLLTRDARVRRASGHAAQVIVL